jgi:hypothetical protein
MRITVTNLQHATHINYTEWLPFKKILINVVSICIVLKRWTNLNDSCGIDALKVQQHISHINCTPNYSSESLPNKAVAHSIGLFLQLKDKCSYKTECRSVVLCNFFLFYCFFEGTSIAIANLKRLTMVYIVVGVWLVFHHPTEFVLSTSLL